MSDRQVSHLFNIAYRHQNGEVEGFRGFGLSAETAQEDAVEQIKRKLKTVEEWNQDGSIYDESRVIRSFDGLTKDERDLIQKDWKANVRYKPTA